MAKIPNPILDAINAALKAAGQKTVQTASKSVAKTAKKASKPKKARPFYPTPSGKKPAFVDPRKPKPKARRVKPRTRPLSVKEAMNRDFEVFKPAKPAGVSPQRVEKTAAPKRSEKQIENIMKHNPQFSREQAAQVAGMSREQRRELNAALHRAKTEAAAAEKKAGREATQAKNRIAHREKNEAKMNRYEKYKMENPTPQKRARKKGAK